MNKQIPFHRPLTLPQEEKDRLFKKIENILSTGMLTNNKEVTHLEETIADYYSVRHAIATSSCSQGLETSLRVLKKNQKIISTPAFAWYSSKYAIESNSLYPTFHDIDINTWNMKSVPYNAAIPVHTFGNVCSYQESINKTYLTIYDAAHALGSRIRDFGDATVLSLAPTKIITSIEGGIILTDETETYNKIKEIRDKVSRMSEIHAAFGNTYFQHIDEVMKFKSEVYKYYKQNLKGIFQETDQSTNHNTIGMLSSLKIPPNIETRKYYIPLSDFNNGLDNTYYVYNNITCLPSWFNCPYKEIVEQINKYNQPL